jgi:undecaprenyl-phosphate 4-deoxy-4-formamido-L-arabinose transferase
MGIDATIICSIHNEEGNIPELTERIYQTLTAWGGINGWEVLLIDDASSDNSWGEIQAAAQKYPGFFLGHQHPVRRGQKGCFMTGFHHAQGRVSVTMDADLQVLPEELPRILTPVLHQGYQVVCTYNDPLRDVYHKQRYDRSMVSFIGNIFMRLLFSSPVRDAGGNFLAVETRFVRDVQLLANDQRYLLPISMRRGATLITEVGCEFAPRKRGKSKYNLWKKALLGIPEMFQLKMRLLRGVYDHPPVPES